VSQFIAQVYFNGEKISPNEARECAEQWGVLKRLAAYYLELADMLRISPRNN
jgi:hypothetical protein